jgi:hypothetical protein
MFNASKTMHSGQRLLVLAKETRIFDRATVAQGGEVGEANIDADHLIDGGKGFDSTQPSNLRRNITVPASAGWLLPPQYSGEHYAAFCRRKLRCAPTNVNRH